VRPLALPLIAPPLVHRIEQHSRIEDPLLEAGVIQIILPDKEFSES